MSHLPFTIAAYLLNSISVTVDKLLLTKNIPDPLVYIFYFSAFSLLVLLLLPFTHLPAPFVLLLASLSTVLWTTGAYFMFKALQKGQVARIVPIIGTLIPIILLIEAVYRQTINLDQVWAVIILVLGMVALTIFDWKGRLSRTELVLEIFASLFFAISYIVLREAYLREQFLPVFVSSRLILVPIGAIMFIVPSLRKRVLAQNGPKINFWSKTGIWFAIGQAAGGSSGLLLTFAVSLATPALVNSVQGAQYAFLFLFSLILSKKYPAVFAEQWTKFNLATKAVGILLISLGLFILSYTPPQSVSELGVTYSPRYAKALGLNPQQTYLKMLGDLNIKYIRLPIYWDEVEKTPGQFDFQDIKFYLDQAQNHHTQVILAIGQKVPRWPECFYPEWLDTTRYSYRRLALLQLVSQEVRQLKNHPALIAWQVENEPLLTFGQCQPPNANLLTQEVKLVRAIDPYHKVLLTASGELSTWANETQLSDWFGTTLYRVVWDRWIGYFNYPFPPLFYQFKYNLARIFAPNNQKAVVVELQTEPWVPAEKQLYQLDIPTQQKLFSPASIGQNLEFAKRTGFSGVYFWGAEWWYYMQYHGVSGYVEEAKQIFNN